MKKSILGMALLFAVAMMFSAGTAFAQSKADGITGLWWNAEKTAKVEIYKKGDKYFGKIVHLEEPNDANGKPKTDTKNDDEKLRSRAVLGMVILNDLEYDEDNEYEDGEIYDPKSGNTYSCNAELKGKKLDLRGYMGISIIGRTSTWTRVD